MYCTLANLSFRIQAKPEEPGFVLDTQEADPQICGPRQIGAVTQMGAQLSSSVVSLYSS
jgi:hypothetical protein